MKRKDKGHKQKESMLNKTNSSFIFYTAISRAINLQDIESIYAY